MTTKVQGTQWLEDNTARAWVAFRDDIAEACGIAPVITRPYGAGRSRADQLALWKKNPALAWHPDDPRANHMKGKAWDVDNWWAIEKKAPGLIDRVCGRYGITRPIKHEKWHCDATRAHMPEPAPAGKEDDEMSPQQIEDFKAWQRLMLQQEMGPLVRLILAAIKEGDLSEDDKAWAREMTRQEIGGALS